MPSVASAESRESTSSASKLAEAIREIIREEIHSPQTPAEKPAPAWLELFWVGIVIANLVMLATQVWDAVAKNTGFDFAFKVIGYVFGGSLVVYASWVREQLMKLTNERWFRATQVGLLVLLIIFRVNLFSLAPSVNPRDARLFVDDTEQHLKRGTTLPLNLATHRVKVLPPEGAEKLPNGLEALPNEFSIGVKDLLFGAYRGAASQWSPLYPLSIIAQFSDSVLVLASDAPLPSSLPDAQTLSDTALSNSRTLQIHIDKDAVLAVVFVPVGRYTIRERRPDGKLCDAPPAFRVNAESNKVVLTDQRCPGVRP